LTGIDKVKAAIRDVHDFPKKGILFKDITPILSNPALFSEVISRMAEIIDIKETDAIAGIESRGFIFGAALANYVGKAFIPIRKPGKLPYKIFREEYELEYGTDALEMHQDAVRKGDKVILIDDLLATGGTAKASTSLIEKCGGNVTKIIFIIELTFLNGIKQLTGYPVTSFIKY